MKTMMVILKSKEKVHFEVREEGQSQGQIKITEEVMDSELHNCKDDMYPKLHNEKNTRERELPVIHTNQASINPSYEPGMISDSKFE